MNQESQSPSGTSSPLTNGEDGGRTRALEVNRRLKGTGLFGDPKRALAEGQNVPWRISPEPFVIDASTLQFFDDLGPHLLRFYEAANRLYLQAVRGRQPEWVRSWLEAGKPEAVLDYARMRRFRTALPVVIRPDIIPTEDGFIISELDSVPGGMGVLAALSRTYAETGSEGIVGGADGIPREFAAALRALTPEVDRPVVAIVVSDESDDYRSEMAWLAEAASEHGIAAYTVHPRQLLFTEGALLLPPDVTGGTEPLRVDTLYRFFELFDLKNIPKSDLILYAIRKEWVVATPPLKHHLEEKSLFALLHHGALAPFWREQLGKESFELLRRLMPETWMMDPTPLPPHAVIPGIEIGGQPLHHWRQLQEGTQRERELVVKPSGFSPQAWGSRGVVIGHDVSQEEWAAAVEDALRAFSHTPHILQRFYKGKRFRLSYYDFDTDGIRPMDGRARLCPYYFVQDGKTVLAGVLATVAPADKKAIHGMVDAITAPTVSDGVAESTR